MIARIIFLIGSVFTLFGIWKLLGPLLYSNLEAEPRQAVIFTVLGIILVLSGRYFEKRHGQDL